MPPTQDAVLQALRAVQDPDLHQDIVALGFVKDLQVRGGEVAFKVELTTPACPVKDQMRDQARAAVLQLPGVTQVDVTMTARVREAAGADGARQPPAGVKNIIAVGAGKGGVGKSTIAVNLAVGLARRGHAVGLMDGDIYGPSLPTMLALDALEVATLGGMIQPFLVHGVKAMTIGKMFPADKPLIWRGPMAHRAFQQLVQQTNWGELDYLVIDLPPGTGDVSLTMAQLLKLTGAVVVAWVTSLDDNLAHSESWVVATGALYAGSKNSSPPPPV